MTKRSYNQARRGETAETTRRRIVEATFALHGEQGIAATTMKQIAARAGVSVGSVYHHFPSYDDAIQACGELVLEKSPPLDVSILDGLAAWPERVERLIAAQFEQYRRLPILEVARSDRQVSPKLQAFLAHEEAHRREMAAAALSPWGSDARVLSALAGLLDIGVWRALVSAGFQTEAAAGVVGQLFSAWMARGAPEAAPNLEGGI